MLDLDYIKKNKEYRYINGNVLILVTRISYLLWLYRIKNKERIIKEDKL